MSALFVFLLVVGGFVLCGVVGVVVMAGGRFLGSGRVGGVGKTKNEMELNVLQHRF